jgi:restriction system protein
MVEQIWLHLRIAAGSSSEGAAAKANLSGDVIVPTYDRMLWPTLKALEALGGSGTIQEIMDKVVEIERYSPQQLAVVHGSFQTEIRLSPAWSRTYLRSVGAIENSSRGVWSITEYGRVLTTAETAGIPARVRAKSGRPERREDSKQTAKADAQEEARYTDEEWRHAC